MNTGVSLLCLVLSYIVVISNPNHPRKLRQNFYQLSLNSASWCLWIAVPGCLAHRLSVCMLSHVLLFATLWTPLFLRFSKQEYWSGLLCPTPRDLPDPGIKSMSLMSPELTGRFFTTNTTWEAPSTQYCFLKM